jgi:hypothetical protein
VIVIGVFYLYLFPGGSGVVLLLRVGVVADFLPAATVGSITAVFSVGLSVWCTNSQGYWSSSSLLYKPLCWVSGHS